MTIPIRLDPILPHVMTGDEWEAQQYAPHRLGQDPKAQLPAGRVLTGDEWEAMGRAGSFNSVKLPALPKIPTFAADATQRLNPNAGKPDQSILESLAAPVFSSEPVKKGAAYLDAASAALDAAYPGAGALPAAGAAIGRQVVAPIVEHPIGTAAGIAAAHASPIVVGGLFAADQLMNAAKYGYQYVHEQMMTPEQRAIAQQDPNRISGETAVVQALMAGLTIFGVGSHINQELGFTKTLGEDVRLPAELRPYVQTPQGATNLGTAAAQHGLPATASPYPPESPLSAAWRDGYDKPRVQIPGRTEQIPTPEAAPTVTEPTVPPAAPTEPVGATNYSYANDLPVDLFLKTNRYVVGGGHENASEIAQAFAGRPEHVAFTEALRRDFGDVITVYRVGDVRSGEYQSYSTDPAKAASFSRFHADRPPESFTVRPEDVAFPGSDADSELIINSDKVKPTAQPSPTGGGLTPIEGTGETRTRGASRSIQEAAVRNGLADRLGDLPQYQQANMEYHAGRAVDLLENDPARARRVALGQEAAPPGMIPEAVEIAVENKATLEGDAATIDALAHGGLAEEATTMGQRLRMRAERNPESPVDAIKVIEDKRMAGAELPEKVIAKEVKAAVKGHAESAKVDMPMLAKFINSLRC